MSLRVGVDIKVKIKSLDTTWNKIHVVQPVSSHLIDISQLKGLGKLTKSLIQDTGLSGQDSNTELLEYEERVLSATPQRSVEENLSNPHQSVGMIVLIQFLRET